MISPSQLRDRLARDHQIAGFLTRIQEQSQRLLDLYNDHDARTKEVQAISTGDPFDEFYRQLGEIKNFHRRYPNEPVENLERAYKRRPPVEGESATAEVDNLFTGEEAWGRFLDLTQPHEEFLNLGAAGAKRLPYLQYLDHFDSFAPPNCPIKRADKETDKYFAYLGNLAAYLEGFLRRTRPLEDLDKMFAGYGVEFAKRWDEGKVLGWEAESGPADTAMSGVAGSGEGIWCADCEKEFKNDNVHKAHLTGKKHIKAAEARKARPETNGDAGRPAKPAASAQKLKQRAIAEREHRVTSLTNALSGVQSATRINVERKQGMTERERQQELEALFAESTDPSYAIGGAGGNDSDAESDSSDKIYNPLKLPLGWDGKPIPFWLYKLHGLGVEFTCEICGNFVYMGRRAFDKHFSEGRHVYGLKCLGITNTALFSQITKIPEALQLWAKLQGDKKTEAGKQDVVQMEDAEGNVMPEKVYYEYAAPSHV